MSFSCLRCVLTAVSRQKEKWSWWCGPPGGSSPLNGPVNPVFSVNLSFETADLTSAQIYPVFSPDPKCFCHASIEKSDLYVTQSSIFNLGLIDRLFRTIVTPQVHLRIPVFPPQPQHMRILDYSPFGKLVYARDGPKCTFPSSSGLFLEPSAANWGPEKQAAPSSRPSSGSHQATSHLPLSILHVL
ncbi:hypothetical protein VTK73DRAFT_9634 [Phialemonium thermophilum]|uniref:Uncharacterized protein n=1 Tax=Phialemonium thermophilum TaxID=223376 RepID=A0ABR3W182_9PEZI